MQDFFSRAPYQYQIYKYGNPYLTYLPQIFLSKLFFRKSLASKVPYLPTVWTYVQNFVVFFWDPLQRRKEKRRNKFAPYPSDRLLSPRVYCLLLRHQGINISVWLYHLAKLIGWGLCSSIRLCWVQKLLKKNFIQKKFIVWNFLVWKFFCQK